MLKRILTLGLNPAWQKSLFFEELEFGEVNRASGAHAMASGKGINFARAVRTWKRADAVVLHPLGGYTGRLIRDALKDENIPDVAVSTEASTRTCSTLICGKSAMATEIIEPSGELSAREVEQLQEKVHQEMKSADALALCGTYPPGVSPEFYGWAACLAKSMGKPVVLDAYKGIHPALEAGIDILKINRAELAALTGCADVLDSLLYFREKHSLKVLAITDGPGSAFLASPEGLWMFTVPPVEHFFNPIGAGDTCTAVLFSEFLEGTAPEDAFAQGLAAASASCETSYPAVFQQKSARNLLKMIRIEKVI